MTGIQYRLSDLLALQLLPQYEKPNNSNFEDLEASYNAWIDAAEFLSLPHKQAWKKAELALLIARAFPDSDMIHLRVCLDWMMLFLVLERLTDSPTLSTDSKRWADLYMKTLTANDTDDLGDVPGPVIVMKHLISVIMPQIDSKYKAAFIASNQLLADGVVQEALDRESADPITLEAYVQTRRSSVGLWPFLDLARWTFDIDLPEAILKHPILREMEEATVDLVALSNDIYSYRKEYLEDGALNNYVTVAMKDPNVPVADGDHQAAIDYTTKQFSAVLTRFVACKEQLPSFFPQELTKIDRYVESMLDLIVGNIQWSISCKRYSLFEDEEARRTGLITIST
ncbi:terpenoid synthase [Hymenopellis radicata]|nr:terpenoid synthase [Hymenopellis radicata]